VVGSSQNMSDKTDNNSGGPNTTTTSAATSAFGGGGGDDSEGGGGEDYYYQNSYDENNNNNGDGGGGFRGFIDSCIYCGIHFALMAGSFTFLRFWLSYNQDECATISPN